jgi:hypothetical protein
LSCSKQANKQRSSGKGRLMKIEAPFLTFAPLTKVFTGITPASIQEITGGDVRYLPTTLKLQ